VVEPVKDVEVKVPGVMAMLVAPVVTQLRVLLEPATMFGALAVKETIAGLVTSEVNDGFEQPGIPKQAKRRRARAARPGFKELIMDKPCLLPESEFLESIDHLFALAKVGESKAVAGISCKEIPQAVGTMAGGNHRGHRSRFSDAHPEGSWMTLATLDRLRGL